MPRYSDFDALHRDYSEVQAEPIKDGTSVFCRRMDVFGHVIAHEKHKVGPITYTIECEDPMPGFRTTFTAVDLLVKNDG